MGIECDDTAAIVDILADTIALPGFLAALPIIQKLSKQYDLCADQFDFGNTTSVPARGAFSKLAGSKKKTCLATQMMNKSWQHGVGQTNPADAARGPQVRRQSSLDSGLY